MLALSVMTMGCGDNASTPPVADSHDANKPKDEVHLSARQMEMMGIQFGQVEEVSLAETVKSNGHLRLPPQKKASLSAVMGGRVKEVLVLPGDEVKKGQVLARLEHPSFIEMQEQYLTAKGDLEYTQQEYERKENLYKDSISSAREVQLAKSKYVAAQARYNGLRSKLHMLDVNIDALDNGRFTEAIPILSPIDGHVRLIQVNIGKYVQPQQQMFEIVDNHHIHMDLLVFEKDVSKVKDGQKVIFKLTNNGDSLYQGTIFSLGNAFEENPKAMSVHAEIDNKNGELMPGMYVTARIVTGTKKVHALPDDAIVEDAGLSYVFVLKPGTGKDEFEFKKVEVKTGVKDMGYTETELIYKLPDTVKIVTSGAFYLLAQMKKGDESDGGGGHHHHH